MITKDDFINSEVFYYYIAEIIWHCMIALEHLTTILATPEPEGDDMLIVSGSNTQKTIATVLSHSANIKKLIKPAAAYEDSSDVIDIKRARVEAFDDVFKDIELNELLNANVRNGLEHFDVRLDSLLNKVRKDSNKFKSIIYNVQVSHSDVFDRVSSKKNVNMKASYLARLYVTSEKTFYHGDRKINLQNLHDEIVMVRNSLQSILPEDRKGVSSGALISFFAVKQK